MSPIAPTRIVRVSGGSVDAYDFDPAVELGWRDLDPANLAGGDPAENAETITAILRGDMEGAARAAVLLNTAAALLVADRVNDLREGVEEATRGLADGVGLAQLERLRDATAKGQIVITA